MSDEAKNNVVERDIDFIESRLSSTFKFWKTANEYNAFVYRTIEVTRLMIQSIKPDESIWDYADLVQEKPVAANENVLDLK